jgi:hypothetical protein
MEMVVKQGPGVAVGFGLRQEEAEAGEEIETILIVKENGSFLDPSDDNVLKQSGDIYAGMSGHEDNISMETENIKNVPFWFLLVHYGSAPIISVNDHFETMYPNYRRRASKLPYPMIFMPQPSSAGYSATITFDVFGLADA